MIVDQFGRPIKKNRLGDRPVQPRHHNDRFITPGMDPEQLGMVYQSCRAGNPDLFFQFADEMWELWDHYRTEAGKRRDEISDIPIEIEPASSSAAHREHADFLRELATPERIGALIEPLTDYLAKGYSVVEILWRPVGHFWEPVGYERHDQRLFRYKNNRLHYLEENGELSELMPAKWAIHELNTQGSPYCRGLAFTCGIGYLATQFSMKNWMAFLETYGLPLRVGRYNAAATEDDKNVLFDALVSLGSDFAAMLPESVAIELKEPSKVSADQVYARMRDHINAGVSKLWLGQTMTTTEGSSEAQAVVHERTLRRKIGRDGRSIAGTLQRQWANPVIAINFGPQDKYPRIKMDLPDPVNQKMVLQLMAAVPTLEIDASWLRDVFNIPEPKGDDVVTGGHQAPDGRDLHFRQFREPDNWRQLVAPVVAPIQAALNANGPDGFLSAVQKMGGASDHLESLATDLGSSMFRTRLEAEGEPHDRN